MIHKTDLLSILSLVVGVCSLTSDLAFSSLLDKQFGDHTTSGILLGMTIVGIVGSQLIRVLNVPAGQGDYMQAAISTLQQVAQALANSHSAMAATAQSVARIAQGMQPPVGSSSALDPPTSQTTAPLHRGFIVDEPPAP